MYSTILTLLVIVTAGHASPPHLTAGISNSTILNATLIETNTEITPSAPPTPPTVAGEDTTSQVEEVGEYEVFGDALPSSEDSTPSDLQEITDEASPFLPTDVEGTSLDPEDVTGDYSTATDGATVETTPASALVQRIEKRGTVVNCFCDIDEVLVNGECKPYPEGTQVLMLKTSDTINVVLTRMSSRRGIIKDLVCDTETGSQELTFSRSQFRLRDRGDIVLTEEAGELRGLRANAYCISHFLDDHQSISWNVKICLEPPNVPRCCPPGQAMTSEGCVPARSPELLTPPISADPYGQSVSWPVIKNYVEPIHCTVDPMKDIALVPNESYLASHTEGVVHIWISAATEDKFEYRFSPKYCVDGRQSIDGSVSYSIKTCFESPTERHQRICDGNVCVRKCCGDGEVMDTYLNRCMPGPSKEFSPHMNTDYQVIVGQPLCELKVYIKEFELLPDTGHLATVNATFPPTDYCVDTFSDSEGRLSYGALTCTGISSWWGSVRHLVYSVGMIISLVFLMLIIVCYTAVPSLLAKSGGYHLCHVVSLFIAYASSVSLQLFTGFLPTAGCIAFALMMQFGYLSAFFWLSVLCFDAWRLFKSLNNNLRPPKPIPAYAYHCFAWGGPSIICSVTLIIQHVDTYDIPWIIKPNLGEFKCWFSGDMEQLVFFYVYAIIVLSVNILFIVHTLWIKRKVDKNWTAIEKEDGMETLHRSREWYSRAVAFTSILWCFDILAWQIPPIEFWALTDIINTLQGVIIFVIFLCDGSKRKHMKEKFPGIFGMFKSLCLTLKKAASAAHE